MDANGLVFFGIGSGFDATGGPGEFVTASSTVSNTGGVDGLPSVGESILQGTGTWEFTWAARADGCFGESFSDDFAFVLEQGVFFTVIDTYEPINAVLPGLMAAVAFAAVGLVGR